VTEDDVFEMIARLPGVATVVASEVNGAPEVAWGDSFFFYDPEGDTPVTRRLPFATIVTKDYAGFDAESDLDRDGVFRLNLAVGRGMFADLFGYPSPKHPDHHAEWDYSALDKVLPHPAYATQAWISILNPGSATAVQVPGLVEAAHERAATRHRRRIAPPEDTR
jgi:hypothetical protein